jgi:hypothetical protein
VAMEEKDFLSKEKDEAMFIHANYCQIGRFCILAL